MLHDLRALVTLCDALRTQAAKLRDEAISLREQGDTLRTLLIWRCAELAYMRKQSARRRRAFRRR